MRIRLQQLGNYIAVPLPTSVSGALRFTEGVEVDLVVDADRGQLIVMAARGETEAAVRSADFAPAVEDLLRRFETALGELGGL